MSPHVVCDVTVPPASVHFFAALEPALGLYESLAEPLHLTSAIFELSSIAGLVHIVEPVLFDTVQYPVIFASPALI
jgi:hypothetical protein